MLTYREICRKAHKTPNPAPAPAAMRTRFGRLAVASINFRYFFGPNFQRCKCRLGNNAPIIPSPMIAIAAISLSLLPTIEPSLSFIEIDLSAFTFDRVEITDRTIIPGFVWRIGTGSNRSSHTAHGNSRAGRPQIVVVIDRRSISSAFASRPADSPPSIDHTPDGVSPIAEGGFSGVSRGRIRHSTNLYQPRTSLTQSSTFLQKLP